MKATLIILLLSIQFTCFAPGLNIIFIPSSEPIKKVYSDTEKLQAIFWVESTNGLHKYNPGETDAVGILQIRPIMVKEVNRILGYEKYQLSDRHSDKCSVEMFNVFQHHWNPSGNFEVMARIWNGGNRGMQKTSTLEYYQMALNQLNQV
jgi:hypothetical protein